MDQWKLIIQALLLTLFLPLLLWTGLFVMFGWKLFLFLALAGTLLLMYGDKIIRLPMFKPLMRMLLPFAMTTPFYKALRAAKNVKDKKGSSWRALWASLRELLSESSAETSSQQESTKKTGTPQQKSKQLPEQTETAKTRSFWFGKKNRTSEDISEDKRISEPMEATTQAEPLSHASSRSSRSRKKTSDEEIDRKLAEMKAKAAHEKSKKS